MRIEAGGTRARRPELQILAWRRRRLLDAGFDPELADELAGDARIDLHALLELVERGCPPSLAARILDPFDAEDVSQ